MLNKFQGCLLGLACGDAVGVTAEFKPRGSFDPVTAMVGGGPFGLKAGEWTDDTSMALCLAESLLEKSGFDARDQIERYLRWWKEGYNSSTGVCFDIGTTVRAALERFEQTGDSFSGSRHPQTAGNGSIMRLAPVPMAYWKDIDKAIEYSAASSKTTHGTQEAVDACRLFGVMIVLTLMGRPKEEILFSTETFLDPKVLAPKIRDIQAGTYRNKSEAEIFGSGYVVKSLEAALWCFYHSQTYEQAVLKAVNLGDDADTTGAVVGQLAGAYYGREEIPPAWLNIIVTRETIQSQAEKLFESEMMD